MEKISDEQLKEHMEYYSHTDGLAYEICQSLLQTRQQLAEVTAERDKLQEQTRWIPVEELPETTAEYIVEYITGDGKYRVSTNTYSKDIGWSWFRWGTILRWMPLPEVAK
jgi:hypothetical protein